MNNLASEQPDILARIKQARTPVEDSSEQPTADVEALPEEAIEEVTEEVIEAIEEPEELPETSEPITEPEEVEELYLDLDGEEVNLNDVREWKQGSLRQADYTKKTQELAEQRKQIEAYEADLRSKQESLSDAIAQLEVQIEAQEEINWEELRDYDPSEYIKQTELRTKREQALEKAKAMQGQYTEQQLQAKAQQEVQKLVERNGWIQDGKETEQYAKDMETVKAYLDANNVTEAEQQGILTSGFGQYVIDASKAWKASSAPEVKKVKRTQVVTKPSGARKPAGRSAYDKALAAHRKHGTPETAYNLRKAQRKLKGN